MLKLHHVPGTRSGRILWLLEELGLEYELNTMEFHPKNLKSDEHRARHPLGRVPALEDGEVTMFESGAIVDYIVTRHSDGALKPAPESPLFPEFLQWFHYCEGAVMPPINTIVVQTLLLPPEKRNDDILGQAKRLLTKTIAPVDDALHGREYLIGDFSAVDIMLGHSVFMSNKVGCVPDEMTNVKAYIERLKSRPAFTKGTAGSI